MFSPTRAISLVSVAVAAVLIGTASSAHAESLQECFDKAESHGGEPPTCTDVGGGWKASWPDDATGGGSGGFAFLFILAGLIGIGVVVWKVSTARRLAAGSGMDPGLATEMTLLSDNGLEAAYLAANLRGAAAPSTPPAERTTTAKRLADLKGLLNDGVINQVEHDRQRQAIIDAV